MFYKLRGEPIASCSDCIKKYAEENRDKILAGKASKNYGLTVEQYHALMSDPVCHSCGDRYAGVGRRPHIDHCHSTGVVRGLLCHPCNTALGLLVEDPIRIKALLSYLEERSSGIFSQSGSLTQEQLG